MKTKLVCNLDDEIMEKFELALALNKDEPDQVIEQLIKQYISVSFLSASQKYKNVDPKRQSREVALMNADTGKAMTRIPKWAVKSDQMNHRIVRAFFEVERDIGRVTITDLEHRCSDQTKYPKTYVRDFRGNFAQMKIDAPKSHGKVFQIEGGTVVIWDYVKDTLMEYKSVFLGS